MTRIADVVGHWLGLCRKAPVIRTSPSSIVMDPGSAHAIRPGSSGSAGSPGRIRDGIRIAIESLKVFLRERHLLWFVLFTGLVMLLLAGWQAWMLGHRESVTPYLVSIPFESPLIVNMFLVINLQTFLLESVILTCFVLVLAGLVLYHDGNRRGRTETIRGSFSRINGHTGSLLALSLAMAFIATGLDVVVSQTRFFGSIVSGIAMTVFYLPYAYYFPNELFSVILFSALLMGINSVLLLAALYVVPGIVLEDQGLVPALSRAMERVKGTWREMFGCLIVMGLIIAGIAAVALLVGQSPLLLNHDYDFFQQVSRGQVLMTAVCYSFLAACFALLALGITAAGIAMTDLHGRTAADPSIASDRSS